MATLKALADSNHTVICTIHQPRGSIFNMFDDLMLLSAGRLVYSGPAADAVSFFKVPPPWTGGSSPLGFCMLNTGPWE